MTKIAGRLHKLLSACDLFAVNQFIRYKGESEFKTATGGFFSVAVLVIFAVLFTNLAIRTVNKEIIAWSSETTSEIEPSQTVVKISPSPFLFTVGIMGLNLNDPNIRYFDFSLTERQSSIGIDVSNKNIPLVSCTQQHFSITESLRTVFKKTPSNHFLCPPLNSSFKLFGKYTSPLVGFLQLRVQKCDPALNLSRPCASAIVLQAIEAQLGQFMLTQCFINPLLNPGSANYIDYYLDDRNYIAFTSNLGAYANAHVQDYKVITDQSVLPFSLPMEQSGVIIPELFQNINFQVTNEHLASLFFYKSSTSTVYNRSYYKVDEFFSYVGGLVGVIMGGMMLLSSYNQLSFEVSIADGLFRHGEEGNPRQFNLFQFLKMTAHSYLKAVTTRCEQSQQLKKYEEIQAEMGKQLDISFILERIAFLERAAKALFENGQYEALHLRRKPTIAQAKIQRHYYRSPALFQANDSKQRTSQELNNLTQINIKGSSNQIGADSIPPEQKDNESNASQSSQIDDDFKKDISESIRRFQATLNAGDKLSLRIAKDIQWKDYKLVNKKEDNASFLAECSREEQENNERQLSQTPDQNTQVLRIMPAKQKNDSFKLSHFEFIDNREEIN